MMIEVEEILQNLVACNTIKDKENERIMDYIQRYLSDFGFQLEKREKYLIMSIRENFGLGFIGHSDTVELTAGWKTDPFAVSKKGDELFGLGVCDMKSGIAAFLKAVSSFPRNCLKRGIKIYITYDEEIGFSGIQEIVALKEEMPEYLLIGEPTNNEYLVGCKGLLEVNFEAIGKKVHSSTPEKGKSANLNMIRFLNELSDFYEINVKNEKVEMYEVPYTTMNIGIIHGGSAKNSVSGECTSFADFRIAKESHIDILKNKILELGKKYEVTSDFEIEIKPFFEDIDFVPSQKTAGFMTEASFVSGKRIILGSGPITAHEVNEHISIQSLNRLVEQYEEIIKRVCL